VKVHVSTELMIFAFPAIYTIFISSQKGINKGFSCVMKFKFMKIWTKQIQIRHPWQWLV